MSTLERLAGHIAPHLDYTNAEAHRRAADLVRAILTELREPTDAMREAGFLAEPDSAAFMADNDRQTFACRTIFAAMIDAILDGKA